MATNAERQEWVDYYPEIEDAIQRGLLDPVLRDLIDTAQERFDRLPMKVNPKEIVTAIQAQAKGYGDFTRSGKPFDHTWYSSADLVGKVVRLNRNIRPAYLQGVEVRVLRLKQKNFDVEVINTAPLRGRRFDKKFGCPPALFELKWGK